MASLSAIVTSAVVNFKRAPISLILVHAYDELQEVYPEPRQLSKLELFVNQFHVNVPFLYTLKTPKNLLLSDVFMGYRDRTVA